MRKVDSLRAFRQFVRLQLQPRLDLEVIAEASDGLNLQTGHFNASDDLFDRARLCGSSRLPWEALHDVAAAGAKTVR